MAGTGKAKAKSDRLEAEEQLRQEMELREEERLTGERIEQQDLNQGMDTGTHSSTHFGVNWGPSYRVRREIEQALPTKKQIEARAYELYLQRACEDGHDVEDWLNAEKELKQR
jgi:phage terminase Nu1 subunit (DNA packaging protein)